MWWDVGGWAPSVAAQSPGELPQIRRCSGLRAGGALRLSSWVQPVLLVGCGGGWRSGLSTEPAPRGAGAGRNQRRIETAAPRDRRIDAASRSSWRGLGKWVRPWEERSVFSFSLGPHSLIPAVNIYRAAAPRQPRAEHKAVGRGGAGRPSPEGVCCLERG